MGKINKEISSPYGIIHNPWIGELNIEIGPPINSVSVGHLFFNFNNNKELTNNDKK